MVSPNSILVPFSVYSIFFFFNVYLLFQYMSTFSTNIPTLPLYVYHLFQYIYIYLPHLQICLLFPYISTSATNITPFPIYVYIFYKYIYPLQIYLLYKYTSSSNILYVYLLYKCTYTSHMPTSSSPTNINFLLICISTFSTNIPPLPIYGSKCLKKISAADTTRQGRRM